MTISQELKLEMAEKEQSKNQLFSFLIMFVAGFAGFLVLGAAILAILVSLGIVPAI